MKRKLNILDIINDRIVLLDGAMGSQLINAGIPAGVPSENWNVTNPKVITKIHKEYYDAGSDAVLTNTFGGSRVKLNSFKQGDKVEQFNRKAVELARSVCPEDCFIGGDIGPTGRFLPPVGDATTELFFENFFEQAKILAENDVDFFFIETMVDLEEAIVAIQATRRAAENIPIITSMTFQKTKRGFFTIMGNSIEQCVSSLIATGVDALGANCTINSNEMIELISQMREKTLLPICAKPNAGKPDLQNGEVIYPATPEEFAYDIMKTIEVGGRIVGGCCGTNPTYIKLISEKLKGLGFEAP